MPRDARIRIWGLIPAAGMSRRMGTTKQTLPFRGSTVTGWVAQTMLDATLDGVIVVTRTELRLALNLPDDPRLTLVFNDDRESEMIDSIRLGVKRIDNAARPRGAKRSQDGVLVVPGDMPTVSAEACRRCMGVYRCNPDRIVIATFDGQRGHPMVFPLAMHRSLDRLRGGLKELVRQCSDCVTEVAMNDATVLQDMDTAEDYRNIGTSPVEATPRDESWNVTGKAIRDATRG